jgi:acyl-CoA thioester hydrolase
MADGFSFPVRVYWEDTDGGGIVYHASYLRFLERGRTEWLRAQGWSQTQLAADSGVVFAVTTMTIDFRRPARLDDVLRVVCEPTAAGAASVTFEQQILRDDAGGGLELLVSATVKVACVGARTLKPQRLPGALAAVLLRVKKL